MLMKNYTAVSADTVIIARKKWGKKYIVFKIIFRPSQKLRSVDVIKVGAY